MKSLPPFNVYQRIMAFVFDHQYTMIIYREDSRNLAIFIRKYKLA